MSKSYEMIDDMLIDLGMEKNKKDSGITWNDVAEAINNEFEVTHSSSYYRKRFAKIDRVGNYQPPLYADSSAVNYVRIGVAEDEKQRMRAEASTRSYRKALRTEATMDALKEELADCFEKISDKFETKNEKDHTENVYQNMADIYNKYTLEKKLTRDSFAAVNDMTADKGVAANNKNLHHAKREKAIYAMFGDLHYGLTFDHFYDSYSPEIAKERVMRYADEILEIGKESGIDVCYVSLMGDMISGAAHETIRLENTKTVVEQVLETSELVSCFLRRLSGGFDHVFVNSVDGNHSRIDMDLDKAPRKERLDVLIPFYAKLRLADCPNVEFKENEYDSSIANFNIFGKEYVSVHGDFDKKREESIAHIQNLIGKKVDCFLMGHMHVPEMRMDDTMYVRNGALVSGGDDYTAKRRLFGPASQVCLIVSGTGIDSLHVIRFGKAK